MVLFSLIAGAVPAYANGPENKDQPKVSGWNGFWGNLMHRNDNKAKEDVKMNDVISGTVSSVSGNTITVSVVRGWGFEGMKDRKNSTSTVATTTKTILYAVDATSAKIIRDNATTAVSSIVAGDMVVVQGSASSTNMVAKTIRVIKAPEKKVKAKDVQIEWNGQPIVSGKITVIGSSTITITNESNVTYAVDVSSAKVWLLDNTASSSAANLKVGDKVIVQGTVNGTSISASTIVDQNSTKVAGVMKKIGNFFSRLFRF
jgi:hypothetical protein